MGMVASCPFADDLDRDFEAALLRSLSFGAHDVKNALRSFSFNGHDSERPTMKSFPSGKMIFEGSLSFKRTELDTRISLKAPCPDSIKSKDTNEQVPKSDSLLEKIPPLTLPERGNRTFQAALKLQKVYKSFRTRRQLADCAVLVEQRWWKVLDFAELKRSSISFFDIERTESVFSRWSRARTRAAKVGKGLSKDEKARKLALQHWLEAIDPRHRYGHNLQFYYVKWLHCESRQPFFYWLDIGEGKEVNLVDRCPRSKLQQQCIKYLGPIERKAYEVIVENGKFLYKQTRTLIDTVSGPKDTKWIFVLSTSKKLYIGKKSKGTFQHSSFLAGGATLSAGRLVVEEGVLKAVWPHSGHYLPTEENFQEFMLFLRENDVDLTNVTQYASEEEETGNKKVVETDSRNQDSMNLFNEDQEEENAKPIPKEKIMMRINSHKGMKSYQLAQQLSSKWTTGAGPRIGCMRDYPSELQFRVLEQVNFSPRSAVATPSSTPKPTRFGAKVLTPAPHRRETNTSQSALASEQGDIATDSNTSSQ
ncbi:unnamed protein product, partial [Vitis vinifera]|uniref:IQ domain-containing protein IQM6 n=1 Tax=Vitis vinifera TaxID=29760 RepID=D7TI84_VITVI